jgi:Endonuclease-reverse transcriptase
MLQINLNKSEKAHLDLLNNVSTTDWDVILIQEPHIVTPFNHIRTPRNFRQVFPENRARNGGTVRSIIWVSKQLETTRWEIVDIPDTNDITAIQLTGGYGKLTIFNIYNSCTSRETESAFRDFLRMHENRVAGENAHMLWMGDFNRHHPLWDRDEDTHLFTSQARRAAEPVIDLVADHSMVQLLPKGIPTLQHMVTKRYSRPDNVFGSSAIEGFVTICDVSPSLRPPCTDHFPIVTTVSLPQSRINDRSSFNFREVDWDLFRKTLEQKLATLPPPEPIETAVQLTTVTDGLMKALVDTVEKCVKRSKPGPDSKRWWTKDLKKMRRKLNRLRAGSYKLRAIADHPVHREYKEASNKYGEAILVAKRTHWTTYLEEMTSSDIWTANRYLREPVGDGGCPRIPTLRGADENGNETKISDNEEKARLFAKTFFPPPPDNTSVPDNFVYPNPLPDPPLPTEDRIASQIRQLAPYKAPGQREFQMWSCNDALTC